MIYISVRGSCTISIKWINLCRVPDILAHHPPTKQKTNVSYREGRPNEQQQWKTEKNLHRNILPGRPDCCVNLLPSLPSHPFATEVAVPWLLFLTKYNKKLLGFPCIVSSCDAWIHLFVSAIIRHYSLLFLINWFRFLGLITMNDRVRHWVT